MPGFPQVGAGATRWLAPLLALLALAAVNVRAEDGWELRLDEDGLRVETREVAGSKFRAFRAELVVPAAPAAVLARLRDIDSYPAWFPDTVEARRIAADNGRWANYVRTSAPWPVKDRDAIYVSELEETAAGPRVNVATDPALAPETDAVRIREAAGFWLLAAVDGGTRVYWEFHVEPGGNIPASLANARVVSTPRDALLALRAHFRRRDADDSGG